jgi:hypothetical protein
MAIEQSPVVSIAFTDEDFKYHFQNGVSWALRGDLTELNDAILVQYVRDNILGEAFDCPVSEDDVKRHTAFLLGWILNAREGVRRA